jgi:hypothetical protein
MRKRIRFTLGTVIWIVFVCACFMGGLVHGKRGEQRRVEDALAELRQLFECDDEVSARIMRRRNNQRRGLLPSAGRCAK